MRRRERGQSLAEFALVAPLFFLLLFGIIEAGRFNFFYETLSSATRDGARYAIVNGQRSLTCSTGPDNGTSTTSCDPTGEDVVDKVRASAVGMAPSAVVVDRCWWYSVCDFVSHGDGNYLRGATVTVHATYTYASILPLPLPTITVEAESSLVINN
jgi:hypothetical protein